MKYLRLFENNNYDNVILINADTNAVMMEQLGDLDINRTVIDRAKEVSPETFDTKDRLTVIVRLFGFSNGIDMVYYDNGEVIETTESEYRDFLSSNNIKIMKDILEIPSIDVDMYG